MQIMCIALGAWVLGVFSAFFVYGWLEHSFDSRANIPWRKDLETCVHWDLVLARKR